MHSEKNKFYVNEKGNKRLRNKTHTTDLYLWDGKRGILGPLIDGSSTLDGEVKPFLNCLQKLLGSFG